MNNMEKITQQFKSEKLKTSLYGVCAVALIGWCVFRFTAIGAENARAVFNPARYAADAGAPVYAMEMQSGSGVLREPIEIKNNRALVSSVRVGKLRPGQRVGDGEIVSVSRDVDLNTGMHIVRTRGASDGLQYAEFETDGYFVPLYAVNNGVVMLDVDGTATPRNVDVVRTDAQNALVAGLHDGDVVILSHVDAGDKVQVVK